MADNETKQFEKPLNLRERIGIIVLLALVKLVKPGEGPYYLDDEIKKIKEYVNLV